MQILEAKFIEILKWGNPSDIPAAKAYRKIDMKVNWTENLTYLLSSSKIAFKSTSILSQQLIIRKSIGKTLTLGRKDIRSLNWLVRSTPNAPVQD